MFLHTTTHYTHGFLKLFSKAFIIESAEFVLKNNTMFSFDSVYYPHTQGMAMYTILAQTVLDA